MGDRVWMFNWLMEVGALNNATVHITGGPMGADLYLGKHSQHVSSNWSHYVSVPERCGMGPFHDLRPFTGCRCLSDAEQDFAQPLFSGENGCVVIMRMYNYRKPRSSLPKAKGSLCHVEGSRGIAQRAQEVVAQQGLPSEFGAVHIRRCDMINETDASDSVAACTAPEVVAAAINDVKGVQAWVVFYYAEAGYTDRLKDLLQCPDCNRTVTFEDSLALNPYADGDNMYSFMVASYIYRTLAAVLVETKGCQRGAPQVLHKKDRVKASSRGGGEEEEELEASVVDSELFGVCGGG
mmetsp:Transcript_114846/g.305330  ORF Transcript_114846/g.305330 Transcript_114846/m.305330 type:complete len:294 (-) Transcript_114846:47-928(-)